MVYEKRQVDKRRVQSKAENRWARWSIVDKVEVVAQPFRTTERRERKSEKIYPEKTKRPRTSLKQRKTDEREYARDD